MQVARPAAMDLKTDLDCLIECLRYCHDDATRARDVILTIASLCSGSDTAQNFLRTSGGLSYLVNLLSTTKDEEIRVATLYALGCAVERNVFSQSRLCTEAMFQFLYCQLPNDSHSSVQLKRTTTFLIMCLVTNNGKGQTLVRKTKCLDAMLQLFRQYPGLHLPFNPDSKCLNQEDEKLSLELWKDVTGTLCGCVNNPQNDENQLVCASSVPAALYIMSQVQDSHVIQLLCSYFSLLAANNAVNQDRFHLLGGLEVIVTKLTSIIDDIMMEPEKGLISSASNMISMLSSVIADNDNNLKALSTLKVVPLLLKLLALDMISQSVKLKVIITLGCLVSANEGSKKQVVECGGLKLLLGFMMANQDEECAKAAMLVLHSCINSDKDTTGEEESDKMSQKGCGSPEKEGQVEKRPLRGQYKHLAAKIDILQKALIEERRLRKSLEDERASKEESIASMSQEGEEAGNETGAQELPLESHHNSAATTAADQGIQQKVASDPDVSIQSSQSFIQLQERLNALEQKLKVVTSTTTETDLKHGSTSSDTSGSELEEDLHCSVSEAENDETEPFIDGRLRKKFRQCDKANQAKTKANTSGDFSNQHLTAERNQSEGTREFKIPPPVKRRMPLQLVHGNMADKETRTTSSRTDTLSSRNKLQRERGEVTPPAKVQKVGSTGRVMLRDFIAHGVPRETSSGRETPRTRRSGGSRVYRTLTYNHADEAQVLTGQQGKWKQEDGEGDSDVGSESSDASEVSSIADSVFSSLNLHLSCPIKPVQPNAPLPCRPSPLQSSRKSAQIVIKPARPVVPLQPTPSRMKKDVDSSKDCGTQSGRVAKSVKVYDFAEEVADSKKRSSHVFLPLSAISSPISVGSHKRCSSTSASHLKHFDGSKELVDKLNATPKVMLKKHSLKGRNIKMYTFDGEAPTSSSGSNKLESHPGQDEHRMSHLQKHQGGFGLLEGSRISTSSSVTRRSGSKRKSYSVRYVRGKIQCSQLYRSASGIGRSPADYSSFLTCPGCVPPRHCPLLDSHTLLRALRSCRHDLCKRHARLMNSLASYISNKMKVFDL